MEKVAHNEQTPLRRIGRILDWDTWPTLPCEELANMVNLIRAGVCPQEDNFAPAAEDGMENLRSHEEGTRVEIRSEAQEGNEVENREDSGFVEGHDFQEKQEAGDQAKLVVATSGFDSLLDLYLELPTGGGISTTTGTNYHHEHERYDEEEEGSHLPVTPTFKSSLHLSPSQISLDYGMSTPQIFSRQDYDLTVLPGFEVDRLRTKENWVLKQVVPKSPLIHTASSAESPAFFNGWQQPNHVLRTNQLLGLTGCHIPDGASLMRLDSTAANYEHSISDVRANCQIPGYLEEETKEQKTTNSCAEMPDIRAGSAWTGLLIEDYPATNDKYEVPKIGEHSSSVKSQSYTSMGAPLGLSTFLSRWKNYHPVLPLEAGEFYDEDGFLAVVQSRKRDLVSVQTSHDRRHDGRQAAVDQTQKHSLDPEKLQYRLEATSLPTKSPVEIPKDSTGGPKDNISTLDGKTRLRVVDGSMLQDQIDRSRALRVSVGRIEQVALHRQFSTFSWNPTVIEQSSELAIAIADAYNERRESIERNRSIRGIPGDFLEPHATMMQRAADSLAFLHQNSRARDFCNKPPGMIAQHGLENVRSMVKSMAEAEERYMNWSVYDQRRMELPAFGFALDPSDLDGEADQTVEVTKPALVPSKSVCSFAHITQLANGQDKAIENCVDFPDEKAEEEIDEVEGIGCEPRWYWPFKRVKRALVSENLRANRRKDVKKRRFWRWKPKSQRRKLTKRPPLDALPAKWT